MPILVHGVSKKLLDKGADIVVCPRVTDAAVVMGPALLGDLTGRDDFDKLLVLLLRAISLSVVVKQQEETMLFLKKSQVLKM